jgi:hypothetical protein
LIFAGFGTDRNHNAERQQSANTAPQDPKEIHLRTFRRLGNGNSPCSSACQEIFRAYCGLREAWSLAGRENF